MSRFAQRNQSNQDVTPADLLRTTIDSWRSSDTSEPASVWSSVDKTFVVLVFMLITVGLVFIASSSVAIAEARMGDAFYYLKKYLGFLSIASVLLLFVIYSPMKLWLQFNHWLLGLSFMLLLLVLVPEIGVEVNGSRRWINLLVFNFQVAEFAKAAMLLFISAYLVRRIDELRTSWKGFTKPILVLGIMLLLFLEQPDFGSGVLLGTTVIGMLFLAGIPIMRLLLVMSVALAGVVGLVGSSSYRMERLTSYLNPWEDHFDTGYQLTQALIAFGRGEWFGVGLGNSLQKLFYLPEAHTDFVFAVLAEETGLVGVTLMVILLWLIGQRILKIGRECANSATKDSPHMLYAGYLCLGIGLMFIAQCFINIGVSNGLLPTKGLTLPFVSYGGSSLLLWIVLMGLVMRSSIELSRQKRVKKIGIIRRSQGEADAAA